MSHTCNDPTPIERLERTPNGLLPCCAWPGGYPIFYFDDSGNVLCPTCANDAESAKDDWPENVPTNYGINWEDGDCYCDECCKRIPSAYAEADREDEDE